MDYYAIIINIQLGVLTWEDTHDALFYLFFLFKDEDYHTQQDYIFSFKKEMDIKGREGRKKESGENFGLPKYKHMFV